MKKSDIKIRKTESTDAKALSELYQGKNIYSGTLQLPNPTVDMWTKRLANIPDNVHSYVAILTDENAEERVVGNLGMVVNTRERQRHVATFGMGVSDNDQGKGIGSALLATMIDLADNWLNLDRIELTVFTDNASAIALYKKFGFVIEGEAVDFAYRNGEYVNAYFMSRIKP